MAFFEDMSPCTYFDRWQDRLLSIGWLHFGQDYTKGDVEDRFFFSLVTLLQDPWEPRSFAGHEPCNFCRFTKGSARLSYKNMTISIGSKNLFVPGNSIVFVAPSTIAHYIDSHEYCPPLQFQEAVISCAEMKSIAYYKQLRESGISLSS